MILRLITFDSFKDASCKALIEYYSTLIGRYMKFEIVSKKDKSQDKISSHRLRECLMDGRNILLSEHGKTQNTLQFKSSLMKQFESQQAVNFYCGNAFGFAADCVDVTDVSWSLSPLTTSHELACVMLCEQLFRVLNIHAGGKYHK